MHESFRLTPLTDSELAEVAVALKARASSFARRGLWNDMVKTDALDDDLDREAR